MNTSLQGEEGLQAILGLLSKVRPSGNCRYSALCPVPAHGDSNPSFSVGLADNGDVWVKCHKPCPDMEIKSALGLPELGRRSRVGRVPLRQHVYARADGKPIAVHVRWKGRGKKFTWQLPDGTPGLNGTKPGLYRRTSVDRALCNGEVIWLVEGEHDADTLAEGGLVATTAPYGAGTWWPEWTVLLTGATVNIVADRDHKGISYARRVKAELSDAGCCVTTFVPPTGSNDVTEMIEAGYSVADLQLLSDDSEIDAVEVRRTRDGRPVFGMLSGELLNADSDCVKLFLLLDLVQGSEGQPMSGRNEVARRLRWGNGKARTHLDHLTDLGFVRIERRGQQKEVYRVVNAARARKREARGPSAGPPPDRPVVQLSKNSGPSQAPLPRSEGLKTGFVGDQLASVLRTFPQAEQLVDNS